MLSLQYEKKSNIVIKITKIRYQKK